MSKRRGPTKGQDLLGFRIPMLASIRSATSARRNERLFGLKNQEGRTLFVLGTHLSLSLNQLVRVSGIETAYASRTIAALAAAGLVRKTVDTADRRAVQLTLTEKGTTIFQALLDDTIAREEEWTTILGPAERAALINMLDRLTERARELAGAERSTHRDPPAVARRP